MSSRVIHRCMAFETAEEAMEHVRREGYGVILRPSGKTKMEHDYACYENGYPMESYVVAWNETVEC